MVVYKAQILQAMHPRAVYYLWLRHKNLREIAQCMHIIAMAGLHKLNNKSGQKFYHLFFIKDLFKGANVTLVPEIVSINEINTGDYETDFILNSVDRFLIIYITSDKSCSGLINGGVYKIVNSLVESISSRYKSVRLISIGKKGYSTFRRRFRSKFYKVFLDLDAEKNSLLVCSVIVSKVMKLVFDKALIIFNRYLNSLTQIVSYYNIFSFNFLLKKISYEQFKNKLFKKLSTMNVVDDYNLVDLYKFSLSIVLLDSLKENFCSETAARARVMENIMQNLDVLINMFWINYQKTRQRRITDEIIEILNGANVANEYSVDARNEALDREKHERSVDGELDSSLNVLYDDSEASAFEIEIESSFETQESDDLELNYRLEYNYDYPSLYITNDEFSDSEEFIISEFTELKLYESREYDLLDFNYSSENDIPDSTLISDFIDYSELRYYYGEESDIDEDDDCEDELDNFEFTFEGWITDIYRRHGLEMSYEEYNEYYSDSYYIHPDEEEEDDALESDSENDLLSSLSNEFSDEFDSDANTNEDSLDSSAHEDLERIITEHIDNASFVSTNSNVDTEDQS